MKKDHNLDDLIIDDIKPAKTKGKSVLTIVALLIILMIVAIVMTQKFVGENEQNSTAVEKNEEVLISPDLKLDTSEHDIEADKKELEQLSSMMEESLTDKKPQPKKEPAHPQERPSKPKAAQIKPDTTQINEEARPAKTTPAANIHRVEENTKKEPVKSAPVKVPLPAAEKPATYHPKPASAARKSENSLVYYIQVGSFSKQPSSQFLSVITRNGFHYQLRSGKLLIGPYKSDPAARKDLPRVKNKINKSAFIKHF